MTSGNPLYGLHPSFHARVPEALKLYVEAATEFNKLTAQLQSNSGGVTLEQYLAGGKAARDAAYHLWAVDAEELNGILQSRIDHYVDRRSLSLAVAAGAVIAAFCLVTFITRSISGPLKMQTLQLKLMNDVAVPGAEARPRTPRCRK